MSIAEKINVYCWNCTSHDCRFCRFNPNGGSTRTTNVAPQLENNPYRIIVRTKEKP